MTSLADLRRQFPDLEGLDDESAVDAIQQAFYPDFDRQQIADRLGVKFAPVEAPVEPRGLLRGAADLGIEAVSGIARGVQFTADAFGADNPVSSAAGAVDEFAREYLSAQAKSDDRRISEIMAQAEDAGIWEQVKAAAQAFAQAPGRMAVNALGTSVPTIAATMIPGVGQAGAVGRIGALAGMGAVQGAGVVKGSIYERVKAEHEAAGVPADEAAALAQQAQEYGGPNSGNIAGGAGLGAAAAATGAQPIIARLLQRGGTQAAAQGAERGLAARTAMGVFAETPLEAAQGGQEQYAGNVALQNEGFDAPTWRGVAGNAALEGLAAAGPGGIAGAMDVRSDPVDASRRLATADNVEDMITAANDLAMAPLDVPVRPRAAGADVMAEIRQLEPAQQSEAIGLLSAAGNANAPAHVRRFAQNRLDELLLPFRQPAAGEATELDIEQVNGDRMGFRSPGQIAADGLQAMADERRAAAARAAAAPIPTGDATEIEPDEVELGRIPVGEAVEIGGPRPEGMAERTGSRDGQLLDLSGRAAVAQYVSRMRQTNTPAARAFVGEYDAGRITPDDVMALLPRPARTPAQEADQRLAAAAAQAQTIQPGDLLTADGMPYGTKAAAAVRATREGGGQVVQVPGGFVVRQESTSEPVADLAGAAAVPATPVDGLSDQPGGSVGAVRPVPAAPEPAGAAAQAPALGGGPDSAVGGGAGGAPDSLTDLKAQWTAAVQRGDREGAKTINDRIVALKESTKASRGPAASQAWVNEGKTPDQLRADKVRSVAGELAAQVSEEAATNDFAPNEVPVAVRKWAADAGVPADELRQEVLKRLSEFDVSDARKAQIAKALDPTRAQTLRDRIAARKAATEAGAAQAPAAPTPDGVPAAPAAVPAAGSGAVEAGGVAPARRMAVVVGDKSYPVESFKQASDLAFRAAKEAEKRAGEAQFQGDIPIIDAQGRVIAHIGYGNKVIDGPPTGDGLPPREKVLYDPVDEIRADIAKKAAAERERTIENAPTPKLPAPEAAAPAEKAPPQGRVPGAAAPDVPRETAPLKDRVEAKRKTADPAVSPAAETAPASETVPPAAESAPTPAPPAAPKRPPKSFRKKVKVTTPVYVEETSSFEPREIDAEAAIKALNEDIAELERFRACLKG